MKPEELIQLNDVTYSVESNELSFGKREITNILYDINFSVYEKEIVGICGESGGGKSTIAKIIAGLIKPTSGELILHDKLIPEKNKPQQIQLLFQNNSSLLNPFRKVGLVIEESIRFSGIAKENLNGIKRKLYDNLSINDELDAQRGYGLSGGERQRIALARLLAVNPKVLILDEPFSAQDVTSKVNLAEVLKNINKEFNCTIICISHDLKILRDFANRLIVLQNGRIVEKGNCDEIFKSPKHQYTKFLLSAEDFSLTEEEIHSQSNYNAC
jgi:ABC-type glutathione transport system ATPase component